jgi:hypothetical protein
MSGRVPIRVPGGHPASAFLSTPSTPAAPVQRPAEPQDARPVQSSSPKTAVSVPDLPAPTPSLKKAGPETVRERQVRFQVYLPMSLAQRVDAEVERRKASGRRGRGKSDYSAIFRELIDRYLG